MREARAVPAFLLLAGALLSGCASGIPGDPVAGHEARAVLKEGSARAVVEWPDAFRRGATFVVVNATGAPIETLFVDLSGRGQPQEIVEVRIVDPAGWPATILSEPHGTYSLRAQLGVPGSVLVAPGGSVRFVVVVEGAPNKDTRATITVPGVSDR